MPASISRDFDGGNYLPAQSFVTEDAAFVTVDLTVGTTYGAGPLGARVRHYGVRVSGVAGKRLRIVVQDADGFDDAGRTDYWRGAYGPDEHGDDWTAFDSTAHDPTGDGTYTMETVATLADDVVYVHHMPWHTAGRAGDNVARWLQDARVAPVPGADAGGVLGTVPAATDPWGRPTPAQPLYGVRLGTGDLTAVLTARVHPDESPGGYILEGAVDWLLGGSAEADQMLSRCTFSVFPLISARSVYAGFSRDDFDTLDDANRIWDGADGQSAEFTAWRGHFRALVGDVEAWFDCHSFPSTDAGAETWQDDDYPGLDQNLPWRQAYADRQPISVHDFSYTTGVMVGWAAEEFDSLRLATLLEYGHSLSHGVADYRVHGQRGLVAFNDLMTAGNFGTVDGPAIQDPPDAPTSLAYSADDPGDTTGPEVSVYEVTSPEPGRLRVALRVTEPLAALSVTRGASGPNLSLASFSRTTNGSLEDYVAEVASQPGTFTVALAAAEDASGNEHGADVPTSASVTVAAVPNPEPTPDAVGSGVTALDPTSYAQEFLDPVLFKAIVRLAEGFQSPDFIRGFLGSGAGLFEEDERWKLEAHDLTVRGALRVFELLISKVRVSIGTQIISNGGGKVESVEDLGGGVYRLRFDSDDGLAPVSEGDLLQAQRRYRPKGTNASGFGIYLSRLTVVSMDAGATYADCRLDQASTVPEAGFEYAQMGSVSNPDRQGLIALTAEAEGPAVLVRDGIDSWVKLDSAETLRAVYGRLNILGVFAGGADTYGLAAGDFTGGWASLTGGGVASGVTFWAGTDQVGHVRDRSIRIGSETSYFLFDADTGQARWVVSGDDQGGAIASISQTVYGDPEDPEDGGMIGALTEIQVLLNDPETGVTTALARLQQEVYEEVDAEGNVTARGALNALVATVYDPDGLVQNQATLRQDVDAQGARQVVSVDGTGGLAEIELSTGNATGNQIRIGTEQLLIEALRTVFGPPGYLTDPTTDAAAWRVPASGPGLGTSTGTVAEDGVLTIEGAVETREAVRWTGGADAPLVVAARGTVAIGARLGIDVAWFSAAGGLVDVTTAISTDPQSQDPEPFDLTGRVEAPANAAYYRVRVDAGTAQDTVDLTSLTAQPQVEAGLLGRTIIDDNGNVRTDRIDVQAVVNAARVVAKEIEAGTGDISLLRAGLAITIDGREGRIAVRDAQGREVSIGAFDFGDVISGEVGTAPGIDGSNGLSQVQAYTGAPAPDDDYAQTHTAAAGAGRSYTVRADLSAAVSLDGPGASGRASATVAAWYEVGGAETAGSRRTASANTLSASSQTDANLALAAAPANATLVVRVEREASATLTGAGGGGLGQGFESAQATASTTGLQVLVDGVSGQFIGPAGTAYVDDDGDSAYMKRAGAEVGMERLFFRGNEYHDNGDGILRRV